MSAVTYTRFELKRTFRNRQALIGTIFVPILFYYLIAGPNRNNHNLGGSASNPTGLFAPQYYMVGLLAFGSMFAALGGGARIAAERAVGWNRQLRLTPLTVRGYLRTKVLVSYLVAGMTMALLYIAGLTLGVRMPFGHWVEMTLLVALALIPFVALGIAFGHLLRPDAMNPIVGVGGSVLAFLGGTWFPITGGLADITKLLPSFWLVQAGHVGIGADNPWGVEGWLVVTVWTAGTIAFAAWAYRRDTQRA